MYPAWQQMDEFCQWQRQKMREFAYTKWQQAGCPQNQDLYFWTEAEKELALPRSIGETISHRYGADDPGFQGLLKQYKERYEPLKS